MLIHFSRKKHINWSYENVDEHGRPKWDCMDAQVVVLKYWIVTFFLCCSQDNEKKKQKKKTFQNKDPLENTEQIKTKKISK